MVISGLSSESVDTNSSRTMISTATTPAEVNTDHFHLLVGICMESLCSSRATQPNSTVSACLNAFYSLLDSQWSRTLIGNEQVMKAVDNNVIFGCWCRCLFVSSSLRLFVSSFSHIKLCLMLMTFFKTNSLLFPVLGHSSVRKHEFPSVTVAKF